MVPTAIRARLRLLARSESGIALPTALFATISSLSLAGAATIATVDVQHGTTRDNGSKSAIAAADAGANVALMRLNRHSGLLSSAKPCLNLNATSGDIEAGAASATESSWCPPVEGEVGGATYSYRISALGSTCGGQDACIVSTGTASEVSRRIELSLSESSLWVEVDKVKIAEKELELAEVIGASESELKKLEEAVGVAQKEEEHGGSIAGLVGKDELTLSGNASTGQGVGVATDGNLATSGNASICGDIQVGLTKKWTHSGNASQCSGYKFTEGSLELPSVSSFIPSDISTHNSNGRITKCSGGLPAECQKDTYNGSWSSTKPLNPSNRSISLSGNTTLTLGGGDYWICSLSLSGNSEIIMAQGAHVRIFFDTPEHCGTSQQISISGNNKITATGYQGTPGHFDMPGLYLLGSTSYKSEVSMSGNASSTNEFVLYGPNSTISISGNAAKGLIVGKTVTLSGNAKIEQDKGFEVPSELKPHGDGTRTKTAEVAKSKKEEEVNRLKKELEELKAAASGESGGRTFDASAYVECTSGSVTAGQQPNGGC
jgi:hypothetical protein